jgi:triosephosphate isomerase
MLIVNFKTYESAIGQKALELAKIHDKVAKDTGKAIIVAVQPSDVYRISQEVSIPVYAQHADNVGFGSNTGWILPEALKEAGATGTLLNHSEHRFEDINKLEQTVKRVQEVGLHAVVCAEHDDEGAEVDKVCKPEFIAIDPPELIGGDISVSTAQPELIKNSIEKIGDNVLVGAGVKTAEDIKIAMEFGAKGVLLASGITKAEDPEAVLRELVSAL